MDRNVALLALKATEWGKMMLQQPQEGMSAVLSSTYLGKGRIHLIKVFSEADRNLPLPLVVMAFCNGFVFKIFLVGLELSSSCSQIELSSKEFQTCERDTHLLKSGMIML